MSIKASNKIAKPAMPELWEFIGIRQAVSIPTSSVEMSKVCLSTLLNML